MNNHKIYFQIVRTYQIIFTRLYFNYFLMDKFTSILPNRSNFKLNQIIFTRLYFNYFVIDKCTSILPLSNRSNFKINQIIFTRLYLVDNHKIYFTRSNRWIFAKCSNRTYQITIFKAIFEKC